MKTALILAFAGLLLAPSAARAQQVKLQLQNGLVTLDAQNVPIRQILNEWARIGGVRIIDADKVIGPPVTLQLVNMTEPQALEILLRGVSGYMLAPRGPGSKGVSTFDRILIMATSTAPRNPAPVVSPQGTRAIAPPVTFNNNQEPQDDNDNDPSVRDQIRNPIRRPPFVNPPGAVVMRPPVTAPGEEQPQGAPPPSTPPPGVQVNPFGLPVGSGQPGAITPVPQPTPDPNRR